MTANWRDKMHAAELPEKVVPLMMRGALAAEHERVREELEQAKAKKGTSLAGTGTGALEEQLQRIEEEAKDSIIEFRLRALPRAKRPGDPRLTWSELKQQHPPRYKDDDMLIEDRMAGSLNRDSIAEPLLRWSIVDPDDITDADWASLMASITDAQFDQLVAAAWALVNSPVDIPFSPGG